MWWPFRRTESHWAERAFVAFVGALLCADVLLLLVPASGGSAETFRVLLAVGAALTVPLAVGLGVAHRPIYAVGGILAIPLVSVYAVSGVMLPWTRASFYAGQWVLEALLTVPVVGDRLATALFGGLTLSERSLRLAFRYHYAAVGVGGLAVALGISVYGVEFRPTTSD